MKSSYKVISIFALALFAIAVAEDRLLPQPPPCIFIDGILVRCANDGAIYLIQDGTRKHILNLETVHALIGENTPVDFNDSGSCKKIMECPAGPDISAASQVVQGAAVSPTTIPMQTTITATTTNKGCPSSALIREGKYFFSQDPSAKTVDRLFDIGSAQDCCAECATHPPCSYFMYCNDEQGGCSNVFYDDYKTCRLFSAPSDVVNRTSWSIGLGAINEWDAGYLYAS